MEYQSKPVFQEHPYLFLAILEILCVPAYNFEIINIRNSEEVKEQLSQLVEENRDRKRVSNREYMDDDDNILDDDD